MNDSQQGIQGEYLALTGGLEAIFHACIALQPMMPWIAMNYRDYYRD